MEVVFESEPVSLKVDGKTYKVYIRQYDDGDYDIEVEGFEDAPAKVYDVALDFFESNGFFDGE